MKKAVSNFSKTIKPNDSVNKIIYSRELSKNTVFSSEFLLPRSTTKFAKEESLESDRLQELNSEEIMNIFSFLNEERATLWTLCTRFQKQINEKVTESATEIVRNFRQTYEEAFAEVEATLEVGIKMNMLKTRCW